MIAESGAEFLNSIRLRAYAKINWSLFVTGKRQDGYHTLDTLLQSVSLYDGIEIIRTPSGIFAILAAEIIPFVCFVAGTCSVR